MFLPGIAHAFPNLHLRSMPTSVREIIFYSMQQNRCVWHDAGDLENIDMEKLSALDARDFFGYRSCRYFILDRIRGMRHSLVPPAVPGCAESSLAV